MGNRRHPRLMRAAVALVGLAALAGGKQTAPKPVSQRHSSGPKGPAGGHRVHALRTSPVTQAAADADAPPGVVAAEPGSDRRSSFAEGLKGAERSPLGMITHAEAVTELITYLQDQRVVIENHPDRPHTLRFSRSFIERARAEFEGALREGERKQHELCSLLGQRLLGGYYTQSVIVGELSRTDHRFELSQRVQPSTLRTETDLALGNRILSQHRVLTNGQWVEPSLVASFVEYHPTAMQSVDDLTTTDGGPREAPPAEGEGEGEAEKEGEWSIYKMISRIKAEQEIFNKVCDEIFDFDGLVRDLSLADKQLADLGYYVKDVFGIKLVVGSAEQARALQDHIRGLRFRGDELGGLPIDGPVDNALSLTFIEVKDHLGPSRKSTSGWECLKSVFEWNGGLFELQIQPLLNYCLERERLTKQSHAAFKQKRERARDQVASSIPLFGYYRELLRTLFVEPPVCDGLTLPQFKNVRVDISE